jgi:outer membrane lipase/esterase
MTDPSDPLYGLPVVKRVIAFGDSLTDSGTFAETTATGRFTTPGGRMWSEYVAQALGHRLSPSHIYRTGRFSPLGGLNYAQSGARVGIDPGLHDSVSWSLKRQLSEFLSQQQPGDQDLYLVSIGGPDILFALMSVQQRAASPQQALAIASESAKEALVQLQRLLNSGATRILMANAGDFGRTPAFGSGKGEASGLATLMATTFNQVLGEGARTLGPRLAMVDAFAVFGELLDRPGEYGLLNTADQAFDPTTTPMSATGSAPNGLPEHLVRPDAGSTYVFADFVHPTDAGHRALSDAALKALHAAWATK